MWMLKDSKGSIKYLKPSKTIKVGRKDADIILENDSSISRAHALITVTLKEQVQTSEESSTCLIKDSNSKYGSFIVRNGAKLKVSKEGLELHHGDTLTFGLQTCTYSVEYIHFVTVISRLNTNHRQKLKSIMDEIGGLILDFYNVHCTHLTATTAATTTKMISSLISGVPIVGIDYWIQVRKCIEENKSLPDPNPFVLSLQDAGINVRKVSLKPNPLRKTLFQKKTFIFYTEKSFKEYREMIQHAGGTVKVYSISSSIPDDLFSDNYIIMKVAINDSSAKELIAFDTLLQNKMKEKNLRTVNETEIPLAIMYACLDQYCNPKYDFLKLLKRKDHVEDTSEVLALDTQDIASAMNPLNQNTKCKVSKTPLIPESVDIQYNSPQSQACLLSQDFPLINASEQENSDYRNKISAQQRNALENDFSSKAKVSNEKKSDGALLQPCKSSNSLGEKEAFSFIPSNNEESDVCDKKRSKNNKRQRETSEFEEINEKIKDFWPSRKRSSIEISKTKTVTESTKTISFKKAESQVVKANDNKKSISDKWGFKKSNKKIRDFDLDDLDLDELTKMVKKSKTDVLDSPTKEFSKNLDSDDMDVDESKKFFNKGNSDALEKRNKKAETVFEPEGDFEIKQHLQLKVKPLDMPHSSYIKSSKNHIVKDEIDETSNALDKSPSVRSFKNEVDVDSEHSCGKMFKKKYNYIPAARVPLAEMTIWKENE